MGASLVRFRLAGLLGLVFVVGCGDGKGDMSKERLEKMSGGSLKEVAPVSGTVFVDDAPTEGVNIYLYVEGIPDPKVEARTDKDGKYCLSTYRPCDGVEAGTYRVAFTYIPKPKKNDSGVDLFKGRYKNPAKSNFNLTVEAGVEISDADFKLSLSKK